MTLSWQKRRSEFNHDWLKNEFNQDLGKWMNMLDGTVVDKRFERTFVSDIFTKWELHKSEVEDLLKDFEEGMSPKVLFKEEPLLKCDNDTKQWLGDLMHQMWLIRHSVGQLVEDANKKVSDVCAAYDAIKAGLEKCKDLQSIQELRPMKELFEAFEKACTALGTSIEKFPSEVMVV